jgi:hypothetical protein
VTFRLLFALLQRRSARKQYEAFDGSEAREGIDIAGAKALHFL